MNVSVNDNDENEERESLIKHFLKYSFSLDKLKALGLSNVDRIIVAQINVNPIRNKFDASITGIQNFRIK